MPSWPRVVYEWGTTAAERAQPFPCDELLPGAGRPLYRGVDVHAPAPVVFRWLCQLRAAPYSYDRVDNGGRPSPQELTPGLEQLAVGQRVMGIFTLAAFEPERSITLTHRGRLFGSIACTYRVSEARPGLSRLVVKLLVAGPAPSLRGALLSPLLAPGDLVMMRRQLLNLRRLAEAQATRPGPEAQPARPGR